MLGPWTANSRGACLITGISATLWKNDQMQGINVRPYDSSGTGYAGFKILMGDGPNARICSLGQETDPC